MKLTVNKFILNLYKNINNLKTTIHYDYNFQIFVASSPRYL